MKKNFGLKVERVEFLTFKEFRVDLGDLHFCQSPFLRINQLI